VYTADQGRLSTFNRFENGSSSQGCADFSTRGYPEVKSKGFERDFAFKFENDGRYESGLGVISLRNTHAKRITTGRESTAKCQ